MTLAIAIVLFVLLATFAVQFVFRPPVWMTREIAQRNPHVLFHVDTEQEAIALTIDDSPHPEVTPGILEVLRDHDAKATFFVIGSYAERHPDLVEAIREGGHELGNHLHQDRMSARLSSEEFVEVLRQTDAIIRPEGPIKWCRPGSGVVNDRLARLMAENGYRACLASVYPLDLRVPETMARWQFMANVRPGAILVLHDGAPQRRKTVQILENVLPRLKAKGYRVVTVSDLVTLDQ